MTRISTKDLYDNRSVIQQIRDLTIDSENATSASENAVNTANYANAKAEEANAKATRAEATANGIDAKATTALSQSGEAVAAAHRAEGTADTAQHIAEAAAATANGIDAKAQTALDTSTDAMAEVSAMDGRVKACVNHISTSSTADGVSIGYATDGTPSPQVRVDIPVLDGASAGVMTPAQMQDLTDQLDTLGRDLNNVKAEYLDKYNLTDVQLVRGNINFEKAPLTPYIDGKRYFDNEGLHACNVKTAFDIVANAIPIEGWAYRSNMRWYDSWIVGIRGCFHTDFDTTVLNMDNLIYAGLSAFTGCNLVEVKLGKEKLVTPSFMFSQCLNLKKAVVNSSIRISSDMFSGCVKLETLVCTSKTFVPMVNASALANTLIATSPDSGYIYVPDDLVEKYKSETNWTAYMSKILPISSLPTEEVSA